VKAAILIIILLVISMILWGVGEFTPREKQFDFGKVYERDGKVRHKFIFTNTGDEPLKLIDVHAS